MRAALSRLPPGGRRRGSGFWEQKAPPRQQGRPRGSPQIPSDTPTWPHAPSPLGGRSGGLWVQRALSPGVRSLSHPSGTPPPEETGSGAGGDRKGQAGRKSQGLGQEGNFVSCAKLPRAALRACLSPLVAAHSRSPPSRAMATDPPWPGQRETPSLAPFPLHSLRACLC